MTTLIKMKLKEWKLKLLLYTAIEKVIAEQKNVASLLSNLYTVLNGVPLDELKDEFIHAISGLAHEEALKKRHNGGE